MMHRQQAALSLPNAPLLRTRAAGLDARQARSRGAPRLRAELAWAGVLCLVILAFMPPLPRADALSLDASPARLLELALLGLAFAVSLARTRLRLLVAAAAADAPLVLIVCLYALWAALTSVVAGLSPTGVVKAAELLAFLVIALGVRADPRLGGHSGPRIVALAVAASIGLLLASNPLLHGELLPMLRTEGSTRVRLILGFSHPLTSALLLSAGLVAVLYARLSPLVTCGLALLLGLLFLLCDARGLSFGLALALASAAWMSSGRTTRAAVSLVLISAAASSALVVALDSGLQAWLAAFAWDDTSSLNGRTALWAHVMRIASEHPLFGVGYFNIRHYILDAFPWAGAAHNSFLEAWATTGMLGAGLFLAFLLLWLTRVATLRSRFLVALSPLLLVEGTLNTVVLVPNLGFIILLIAMANPVAGKPLRPLHPAPPRLSAPAPAPAGRSAP
jgi:O-antigen ligase